jgi:hypothetical protein
VSSTGPGRDGPHAPYFQVRLLILLLLVANVLQSERLDLYKMYATKLLEVCLIALLFIPATYQ